MKQFENILETVFINPDTKEAVVFADQDQFNTFMQSNKEKAWDKSFPYDYALLKAYDQVFRLKKTVMQTKPSVEKKEP